MNFIHQSALYLHISVGVFALLLFWIPMIASKGSFNHKRYGRYFVLAMYIIAISGLLMSGLDLAFPLEIHGRGLALDESEQQRVISQVREPALFLFSLSVLVLTSTRQGSLVIRHKDNRQALRTPLHTALCTSLLLVGLLLLWQATVSGSVLFLIFGLLEIFIASGNLRYNFKKILQPREWWIEHLGALIGSGIGAYTAFFVFGGSRLFSSLLRDAFSDLSIVLWVSPGVIGSIAITLLSRHYRKLFNPDRALKKAQRRAALFR